MTEIKQGEKGRARKRRGQLGLWIDWAGKVSLGRRGKEPVAAGAGAACAKALGRKHLCSAHGSARRPAGQNKMSQGEWQKVM